MSDWKPLYISIILLVILGLVIPAVISPFTPDTYNHDSLIAGEIDKIENGYTIPIEFLGIDITEFNFNPWTYAPLTLRIAVVDYLTVFSYIPTYLTVPLLIIIVFGIVYTFITMILP
jgi:hypothetical protein